jgi:hypothetical protein
MAEVRERRDAVRDLKGLGVDKDKLAELKRQAKELRKDSKKDAKGDEEREYGLHQARVMRRLVKTAKMLQRGSTAHHVREYVEMFNGLFKEVRDGE